MDWSDSWRGAFRIELRAQAIGLASRGWPVMPGGYPAGSQWTDGRDSQSDDLSPVHVDWAERVGADPEQVVGWWNDGPYNLLVATGRKLDAIEVGADLGHRTAAVLRLDGLPAPIAATPHGRWLFLTTAGGCLASALAEHDDVILHGEGSWIPLPPTGFPHGIVHWRVAPEVSGWNLPNAQTIQNAMVRALEGSVRAVGQELVGADRVLAA